MTDHERLERRKRLDHSADIVAACRKCAIGSTRRNSVYGEGDPCARLMLVGEGPGETEDRTGRPFVGRAGELLEKMLAAIDLPRESVYICNTVKCRPTLGEPPQLRNRPPEPHEMSNCRAYLDEQIEIIRPDVILALGAPAAKTFLGKAFSITRERGRWHEGPLGSALVVTFHPAYVLRQGGTALTETKRLVWADLKSVRERLREIEAGKRATVPLQPELF